MEVRQSSDIIAKLKVKIAEAKGRDDTLARQLQKLLDSLTADLNASSAA